ncbi:MAG: RloB family protein [Propionibacteriaceae bacterium]|jgi:hypothetical protein|nr:RloB family protein [Propionibacteriaceae bacterium]
MGRRTSAKELRRRQGSRKELRAVVVFSEGETECEYIEALMRLPDVANNTALTLEIDPDRGLSPLTLVQRAVERLKEPEVNECWCVFDVEWPQNHAKLAEARSLARSKNIGVAISNPCFELWLILHYESQTGFLDTSIAQRRSQELGRYKGKHIDAGPYLSKRHVAVSRADALETRHEHNNTTFPHDNPSSGMPNLLRAIGAV